MNYFLLIISGKGKKRRENYVSLNTEFITKARDAANALITQAVMNSSQPLFFTLYKGEEIIGMFTGGRWYYPMLAKHISVGDYVLAGDEGKRVGNIGNGMMFIGNQPVSFNNFNMVFVSKKYADPAKVIALPPLHAEGKAQELGDS